jgi:hypothetical protein
MSAAALHHEAKIDDEVLKLLQLACVIKVMFRASNPTWLSKTAPHLLAPVCAMPNSTHIHFQISRNIPLFFLV